MIDDCVEGGHHLMISYLLSPDPAIQRVGALGLHNMATTAEHRLPLVESGVLEPIMSLAR